jgi:transposase
LFCTGKIGRPIEPVLLTEQERTELQRRVKAPTSPRRAIERAEIILLRADGIKQEEVAERLGCSSVMVAKWTARFRCNGLEGLSDKAGRGRKPSLDTSKVEQVIAKVTRSPEGRQHWSTRSMAKHAGISHCSVQRIWKLNDLKPHLTKVFKISNDPHFEKKVLGCDRSLSQSSR